MTVLPLGALSSHGSFFSSPAEALTSREVLAAGGADCRPSGSSRAGGRSARRAALTRAAREVLTAGGAALNAAHPRLLLLPVAATPAAGLLAVQPSPAQPSRPLRRVQVLHSSGAPSSGKSWRPLRKMEALR